MTRLCKLLLGFGLAAVLLVLPAMATNSLTWNGTTDRVNADLQGITLWPFLEQLAHKTGWHIFVEPGTDEPVSTKFKDLPSGEALKRVLGELNFALVPQTNGPACLYIFRTSMQAATRPLAVRKPATHVPNELLVKLKPGANIDAIAKLVGAKVIGRNDKLGLYRLQFPDAAATDAALEQLKTNPDVEAVDYNYYYDPPPPLQAVPGGANVPAPAPLTLDTPSQDDPCNVVIGLIDTPIQAMPSNLAQFVEPQLSATGDPCDSAINSPTPTHATGMAQSILRAMSQASGGHTSAKILPVDAYGCDPTANDWNVANAIAIAVKNHANIINLSLGSPADSAVMDSVIQQGEGAGIVFFAAAGNEPVNSPTYPAAIPGVNAVTAAQQGQLASYANYGSFIDMALPGTSIIYAGGQPWQVEGTSVSTAYATGVAAGTKTSNCDGWPQIQAAMQQKFTVPAASGK